MTNPPVTLFSLLERTPFGRLNLRAKLIIGNLLVTFAAIVGMGYYVYYRTQESNAILTSRLESSVRNKAEEKLSTTSKEQSALLNKFFESMGANISMLSKVEKNMLTEGPRLNTGTYWDSRFSLSRLPSGSWDNSNTETSSVFMPANTELTDELAANLNVLKQTELIVPSILQDNPDIIAIYFGGVTRETIYFPNIDLANIVPPDFDVTGRPWFVAAKPENNPEGKVVWSTPYQDAALNGLVITTSIPVFDAADRFQGVSAMDIQLNRITNLVSAIHIGDSGYAFLIDRDNRLIALPESGYKDFGVTSETVHLGEILDPTIMTGISSSLMDAINQKSGENLVTTVNINGVERFFVYQQIPELQYSLVILVPSAELLTESSTVKAQISEETKNIVTTSLLLVLLILGLASAATLVVGNELTAPLKSLTAVANDISKGNYNAKAEVINRDEIGTLAETLNLMTGAIKESVNTLEQRVAERTTELKTELEKGARRGKQFEAITRVAKAISATQDLDNLLPQISRVVSEQFNFYHVGIFLNDPGNIFAVLSAANSPGGLNMLARGHQLKIGEQGIVGFVTQTGKPRIALDVEEDTNYFNNPDLPMTRSEMALPLVSGSQIIGALDIQSQEVGAFSDDDFETLSALADQVSLAIQNARLYEQTKLTLAESDSIQRQYIRETWNKLPKEEKLKGFRFTGTGVIPLDDQISSHTLADNPDKREISVPVILRGETIGTLAVQVPKDEHVTTDQMDLIKAVAERVALSAENARLFEETTRRAERERIISDIATKIGTSVRTESILRTTATELSHLLDGAEIFIKLGANDEES
ncbi:MAG: GAF domain-containing protein [Chloroflexi bacterium]|nr:GAF domain-containing protein [Chloroflexota bacterium]